MATSGSSQAIDDAELLARFEDATLPTEAFHHAQHVRVAWMFVRRFGMPDAIGRFSEGLRRFADAKGKPALYHQTMTWGYLLLIGQRVDQGESATWEAFATANPDLLTWKPSLLDRYYTAETLCSDLARRTFVMPDRIQERGVTLPKI